MGVHLCYSTLCYYCISFDYYYAHAPSKLSLEAGCLTFQLGQWTLDHSLFVCLDTLLGDILRIGFMQ